MVSRSRLRTYSSCLRFESHLSVCSVGTGPTIAAHLGILAALLSVCGLVHVGSTCGSLVVTGPVAADYDSTNLRPSIVLGYSGWTIVATFFICFL